MSSSQGKTSGRKGLAQFLHLTQNEPPLKKEEDCRRTMEETRAGTRSTPAMLLPKLESKSSHTSEEEKSKNSGNDLMRDGPGAAVNVPNTSKSSWWIPKRETPQKNGIVKTVSFAETNTNDLEAAKKEARKVAVAKSNSVIEVEAEHKMKPLKLHDSEGKVTPREENIAKKVNAEVKSRPEKTARPPRRIPMGMQNVDRDYLELLQTFATNLNDPLTESWED